MTTYLDLAQALAEAGYLSDADLEAAADILEDALIIEEAEEIEALAMIDKAEQKENVLDADPEHPIVIFPERFHHVSIKDKVRFRVEFYEVPSGITIDAKQKEGERPGQDFL